MSNQIWWYTARAGGIVAWALLAASVVWGLLLSTRLRPGGVAPSWVLDLHRFLGGLAVIFTVVHVVAIMLDSYVHFGLADVLVPFASSWHPNWVAWGITSMYLLLAIEVTSLTRRWLPRKLWRRIHVLSLPLFALATVHFIGTGTDRGNPFAILGVVISSVAIAGPLVRRIRRGTSAPPPPLVPRPSVPRAPTVAEPALVRIPESVGSPGT
ncbi:MAG: ferric reductase-like transmembrane domain-containing protein [Acidimicrobiia bacterium]